MNRDGERIELCNYAHCLDRDCICKSSSERVSWGVHTNETSAVTLQLRRGFYHERYTDIVKVVYFLSLRMDGPFMQRIISFLIKLAIHHLSSMVHLAYWFSFFCFSY